MSDRTPRPLLWLRAVLASELADEVKVLAAAYVLFMKNGSLIAWPSNQTLAEHAGCDQRSVRRRRNALAAAGFLAVLEAGGGRHRATRIQGVIPNENPDSAVPLSGGETRTPEAQNPDSAVPRTNSELEDAATAGAASSSGKARTCVCGYPLVDIAGVFSCHREGCQGEAA